MSFNDNPFHLTCKDDVSKTCQPINDQSGHCVWKLLLEQICPANEVGAVLLQDIFQFEVEVNQMSTDNLAKGSQTSGTYHQQLCRLHFDSLLSHFFFWLVIYFKQFPCSVSQLKLEGCLQKKSMWFNLAIPSAFSLFIYMCIRRLTHIYIVDIHVLYA